MLGAKHCLHTPKAVTYHEQPHYCRFMIGHSLGRVESSIKRFKPPAWCKTRLESSIKRFKAPFLFVIAFTGQLRAGRDGQGMGLCNGAMCGYRGACRQHPLSRLPPNPVAGVCCPVSCRPRQQHLVCVCVCDLVRCWHALCVCVCVCTRARVCVSDVCVCVCE